VEKEQEKKVDAIKEFSRFANQYDNYNIIQNEVAKTIVEQLPSKSYSTIVDIGSGSGAVYQNIEKREIQYQEFIALDSVQNMLDIHPSHKKVTKICADFNLIDTFNLFTVNKYGILLSSSALQWSNSLNMTLNELSKKSQHAYFSLFTSATFKTLHQVAQIESPIYSTQTIKESMNQYYNCSYEVKNYTLTFSSVREMFHYIKRSGISGGNKQLSYKQMKHIMRVYPLDYLEFEVLFVKAESLFYREYK